MTIDNYRVVKTLYTVTSLAILIQCNYLRTIALELLSCWDGGPGSN